MRMIVVNNWKRMRRFMLLHSELKRGQPSAITTSCCYYLTMSFGRRPWSEELAIIDRTMKAISDVTDPEKFVNAYYDNIGSLIPGNDYVSISRRNVPPPYYLI